MKLRKSIFAWRWFAVMGACLFAGHATASAAALGSSPDWTAEGNQTAANFGQCVAPAGDVNGDGYGDVIVGAPHYDNGQPDEGRACLYLGSASGLAATPAWTAESDNAGALFGFSVATAGDVNSDGYSDVLVGAPGYTGLHDQEGKAYLYLGSATGLATTPAWSAEGNLANANFGSSVAMAGDVNNDGRSDVLVGAPNYSKGQPLEGCAFLYLATGTASVLPDASSWYAENNYANASFGFSVAGAGDVNGDGYSDILVGAPNHGAGDEGLLCLYLGSANGPQLKSSIAGSAPMDNLGFSVASAGDINGDGFCDVLAGAPGNDTAKLFLGSATGLNASGPSFGIQAGTRYGHSVAPAGDVNGDGYADILVGAAWYTNGQSNEGFVALQLGSATGLVAANNWQTEGNQNVAMLGFSVAGAGDVNGDGYCDVIAGAWAYDNGQIDEGKAYVWHGKPSGPAATAAWQQESGEAGASCGASVASAGDVNGDGYGDVIVGADADTGGAWSGGRVLIYHGGPPSGLSNTANRTIICDQLNAQFGTSVAGAGDVNGDGYADVIAGAPFYGKDGEAYRGRVFVYHGSASGIPGTAAWTADGTQDEEWLGGSVAPAGDVNGDGFADVIMGAMGWNGSGKNDIGKAMVYLGSSAGLLPTPAWTVEGTQSFCNFGASVACAGDVNRDGYSDVIVGAPGYVAGTIDEGRAYLFLGSAGGLSATPAWSYGSNQGDARFGAAVAGAGDVNGDGYSDVIVGADVYDNGFINAGRVCVFLGTATGLAANPGWTVEGNSDNTYLGGAVASAGDVNGDGFSDIIIGAPGARGGTGVKGEARVYLGSAGGLGAQPAWTIWGTRADDRKAMAVASAGDVNGDGCAEVIVGEPDYSNGCLEEGRARLFYGNGEAGPGVDMLPQQLRYTDRRPIVPVGLSDAAQHVAIRGNGRTPWGHNYIKYECEIKPLGMAFDGLGLQWIPALTPATLTFFTGTLPPSPTGVYHWRVRCRYNPVSIPFPVASRWMTIPIGSAQEGKFRAGVLPPRITAHPADALVATGSPVTFTVAAESSTPLTYQWRKFGVNIPGVTGASCTISAAAHVHAGDYDCVVTNAGGSVISNKATLEVLDPPAITRHPADAGIVVGGTPPPFSVTATGGAPLSYQWRKGGTPLPGETESQLALANIQESDAGDYDCVVRNVVGTAVSNAATLTVYIPAEIIEQPSWPIARVGETTGFAVEARGTPPLLYQWSKDGTPLWNGGHLSGAQSATLNINGATAADAGRYSCLVRNAWGLEVSQSAWLTVVTPPQVTRQPLSHSAVAGTSTTFSIAAAGDAPLSYQWRQLGTDINGATGAAFSIATVAPGHAGAYDCVVRNPYGMTISNPATLTVVFAPAFTLEPVSTTVTLGQAGSLVAAATGTGPLHFQWSKDGTPLSGATSSTLRFAAAAEADAGRYSCLVSNAWGLDVSQSAWVVVRIPGRLAVSPDPLEFIEGTPWAVDVEHGGAPTTRTLTLTNTGQMPLRFLDFIMWDSSGTEFSMRGVPPTTLDPGKSGFLTVEFHPSAKTRRLGISAQVIIHTDSPLTPNLAVPVRGDAVPVGLSSFEVN